MIYWKDKIGKINLYSIGMGDGIPATFIVADVIEDDLYIKGDYSTKYDVLPKNLIENNKLDMLCMTQSL